jgi:hypothetical protein
MPLTPKGKKILQKFIEQYGERGRDVFYASLVKGTIPDRGIHEKGTGKLEKAKRAYRKKHKKKKK